jgi:hypothetical protein
MSVFIVPGDFRKNQREFDARFYNERASYDYLFHLRWPDGFSCRKCGHDAYWKSAKGLCICCGCGYQ